MDLSVSLSVNEKAQSEYKMHSKVRSMKVEIIQPKLEAFSSPFQLWSE